MTLWLRVAAGALASVITLWLLVVVWVLTLPSTARAAITVYAAPGGGGTTCSSGSPCTIRQALLNIANSGQAPGSVLILQGGTVGSPATFLGNDNMLTPGSTASPWGGILNTLKGASGAPIEVRCSTRGGCILDAQQASGRRPIWLASGNHHWIIDGIIGHNANGMLSGGCNFNGQHVTARFVGCTAPRNSGAAGIYAGVEGGPGPILVEDSFSIGQARTPFLNRVVNNVTVRRSFFVWQSCPTPQEACADWSSGDPICGAAGGPRMGIHLSYTPDGRGSTSENNIVYWLGNGADCVSGSGHFAITTSNGSAVYKTNPNDSMNLRLYGNMTFIPSTSNVTTCGYDANYIEDAQFRDNLNYDARSGANRHYRLVNDSTGGEADGDSGAPGRQLFFDRHCTISNRARDVVEGTDWQITNNLFVSIANRAQCDYFNPSGSRARLCRRYQDRTLTETALWPWPADAMIKASIARLGSSNIPTLPGADGTVTGMVEHYLSPIPTACRQDAPAPTFPQLVGFPVHPVLTTFSGSASPPVGFAPVSGSGWTEGGGVAAPIAGFSYIRHNTLRGREQEAYAPITGLPTEEGNGFLLAFLLTDANNRYVVSAGRRGGTNNDEVTIQQRTPSGLVTLAGPVNLGIDIAVNDEVGVRVSNCATNCDITAVYKSSAGTWGGLWRTVATAVATAPPTDSYIGLGGDVVSATSFGGGGSAASADTTPPAPDPVTGVTMTTLSQTEVSIDSNLCTDAVGVIAYVDYCGLASNCSDCTQIRASAEKQFTWTGRTPGTTYYCQRKCTDGTNPSVNFSAIATATTLTAADTVPPTAPTNPHVTRESSPNDPLTTSVTFRWVPGTDANGIASTEVARGDAACANFAPIHQASTELAEYVDDVALGLTVGACYQTRHGDLAGNLGDYSTPLLLPPVSGTGRIK
jgi:hypothetical protein